MKNENGTMETLKTKDMPMIVFLVAHDCQIIGVSGPPNRLTFIFKNIPQELLEKFRLGIDPVSRTIQAYNQVKLIIRRSEEPSFQL